MKLAGVAEGQLALNKGPRGLHVAKFLIFCDLLAACDQLTTPSSCFVFCGGLFRFHSSASSVDALLPSPSLGSARTQCRPTAVQSSRLQAFIAVSVLMTARGPLSPDFFPELDSGPIVHGHIYLDL